MTDLPTPADDPDFWDRPAFWPPVLTSGAGALAWEQVYPKGHYLVRGLVAKDLRTGKHFTFDGENWLSGDQEERIFQEARDKEREARRRFREETR